MVQTVEKIEVREERPVELDEMGKVLLTARDYIREHGWCQNAFMDYSVVDEMPSVCLLGSLNHALGYAIDDEDWRSGDARRPYVIRMGFPFGGAAANWNDTTDRTQQEVEERLERAAYNL